MNNLYISSSEKREYSYICSHEKAANTETQIGGGLTVFIYKEKKSKYCFLFIYSFEIEFFGLQNENQNDNHLIISSLWVN